MDRIRVIMMAVTTMFCMTVTAQNQNSLTESECWLERSKYQTITDINRDEHRYLQFVERTAFAHRSSEGCKGIVEQSADQILCPHAQWYQAHPECSKGILVRQRCGEQTITNNIRHQSGGPQPRSSLIHPKSTR